MLSHNSAVLRIVRSESPWTKDTSGRRNFWRLDASGRLIFCAQMHADAHRRRRTHADEHRRMQNFSAAFFVQAVVCLGLKFSSRQSLPHVGSFSRSRNTAGTRSIVSETPPTNLQRSELAYSWETLLDSWICFIEWSWPYNGLYLMSIACIWPKINTVES